MSKFRDTSGHPLRTKGGREGQANNEFQTFFSKNCLFSQAKTDAGEFLHICRKSFSLWGERGHCSTCSACLLVDIFDHRFMVQLITRGQANYAPQIFFTYDPCTQLQNQHYKISFCITPRYKIETACYHRLYYFPFPTGVKSSPHWNKNWNQHNYQSMTIPPQNPILLNYFKAF